MRRWNWMKLVWSPPSRMNVRNESGSGLALPNRRRRQTMREWRRPRPFAAQECVHERIFGIGQARKLHRQFMFLRIRVLLFHFFCFELHFPLDKIVACHYT